jgi:hypothetical protein
MRFLRVDDWPEPLVLVRCQRCRGTAGLWRADAQGEGEWQNDHRNRCRCDPPPELPKGRELDELVAKARRRQQSPGRAALTVFR